MNWRRWPWLEEGALPLSVLLLRLCWFWPWLLIVGRWTLPPEMRPILPLWMVAALMMGGAVAARFLPVDLERTWQPRAWAAGLGLAAMIFALWWRLERGNHALWDVRWIADQAVTLTHWDGVVPLSIAVLVLSAYLWLRGMQDSAAPNHDDIWRAFGSGFVALVLLLIAGRIDPAGHMPSTERWIVLFFAVGMSALAMAGLRLARGSRGSSAPLPTNRYWAASIATLVAVLLGAGLALAIIVTPDGVARTTGWVRHILGWLATLLGYAIYGLAYVLFLALTPLIYWIQENIGINLRFDTDRLQDMQRGIMETGEQTPPVVLPTAVDESLRWLALLGGLALAAIIFATALRFLRKRGNEDEDEVRETVLSQDLLRDQAASLWQRWRDRLAGRRSSEIDPFVSLEGATSARRRIRAAYQAFLAAMSTHDLPRLRRQTPSHYANTASAHLPDQNGAVETLTDTYITARYGNTELTAEDAVVAEESWSAIRDALNEIEEDRGAK